MSARRGVLLFAVLLIVLGVAVLLTAWGLREPAVAVRGARVLRFDVPFELEESLLRFRPFSVAGLRTPRLTVWEVVRALRRAARDPNIETLALHIDRVDWGWAKLEEVRNALLVFRAAGKPVYASLTGGGEREYLLASAADLVCVSPTVTLQLDGLAATTMFYRGAFDKFGVSPNFTHAGRYKSAVESYTRTGMTAPSRAALEAVLDDHYALLTDTLAAARGMAPDSVRALLDRGPYDASEALGLGLVDTLLHPADVDSLASRRGAVPLPALNLTRYLDHLGEPRGAPRIALVVVSGTIAAGRSRENPAEGRVAGAATLIEALREARTRRGIRAIVLRVDSPGGVADAADEIWREVERCREAKPLVVSMSDLAASGGYYIAVAGDSVIAAPTTLTGSIGVYGGKFNVLGLLRKLGLNVETVSRGRHARMLSPYEDFTREEALLYERHLERFYRVFLARVSRGRHLSETAVDSVAQGRVWTGLAAQRHGLVDGLGGLEDALRIARVRAGIGPAEEIVVETYPRARGSFLSRVLATLISDDDGAEVRQELPPLLQAWIAVARVPAGAVLALMPWSIDIR